LHYIASIIIRIIFDSSKRAVQLAKLREKIMATNFQSPVFVATDTIEEMTYAEYLREHWNDNTTSPRGVENRRQIASILTENGKIVDHSLNDRDGLVPDADQQKKWAVYSWGAGGRGPAKLDSEIFATEEEAENDILKGMERDYLTKSTNAPVCFFTRKEAEEALNSI
jgi:hypothetical protein